MNPLDMWNQLPHDLQSSLAFAVTEQGVDHLALGSEELRHLARHVLLKAPLDPAVPEILSEHLADWMQQQYDLQEQAYSMYSQLAEWEWVDLENDTFPEWRTRPWAEILSVQWSERLPEAIVDAQAYLLNAIDEPDVNHA